MGLAIGAIGLAFVVRELIRQWDEVTAIIGSSNPWILIWAFPVALASMASIGLAWRRCLLLLGAQPRIQPALRQYFVGQLGKYVPGGIWPVVGRAEMARRGGAAPAAAYGSTVLSLGFTYLGAVVVASVSLAAAAGVWLGWRLALGLTVVVGLAVLRPSSLEWLLARARAVSGRPLDVPVPSFRTSLLLLGSHVPAWLGISAATWLVAASLGVAGIGALPNVVFATCVAWTLGFLAIGVPGGIGVREAVFVATALSIETTAAAVTVAVAARLLFVIVDLSGAALTVLAMRTEGRDASAAPPI